MRADLQQRRQAAVLLRRLEEAIPCVTTLTTAELPGVKSFIVAIYLEAFDGGRRRPHPAAHLYMAQGTSAVSMVVHDMSLSSSRPLRALIG